MKLMSEENLINLNPQRVKNRRVKVFGLMAVSTFLATLKWMTVIPTDSWWLTKFLMVALFILTFAWIALFFWSSVFGFIELLKGSKVPGIRWVPEETRLSSKVAVLMPVYNESSQGVFANLLAMGNDLVKTGQGKAFDFFVLSDTTNPKVWVEEEKTWLEAKKLMPEEINLYYRRRLRIRHARAVISRIFATSGVPNMILWSYWTPTVWLTAAPWLRWRS